MLKTLVHGVVEMSRTSPLYGPERLRIEKLCGHQFISGFHDYDITKGGVKVFPRLISSEYRRKYFNESVRSGVTDLDSLLGGGLGRGTCILLQGASGTGKSALATQFAVSAA